MRPTVQTERVLNKLAVSDGQRRLASVPIPFQFRFVPPNVAIPRRCAIVACSRSVFSESSIRVSIRGQFPDDPTEDWKIDGRKGLASGVSAIAGRKRARYRHRLLRGGKCRAAILYDVRKTYASARQRLRGGRNRKREERGDNTERGVSGGVQIYAGATLMSAYVFSFGPRGTRPVVETNLPARERTPLSIQREDERERERKFLSNFYTR